MIRILSNDLERKAGEWVSTHTPGSGNDSLSLSSQKYFRSPHSKSHTPGVLTWLSHLCDSLEVVSLLFKLFFHLLPRGTISTIKPVFSASVGRCGLQHVVTYGFEAPRKHDKLMKPQLRSPSQLLFVYCYFLNGLRKRWEPSGFSTLWCPTGSWWCAGRAGLYS